MTATWGCLRRLTHLIASSAGADLACSGGLQGDHGQRFSVGFLASPSSVQMS